MCSLYFLQLHMIPFVIGGQISMGEIQERNMILVWILRDRISTTIPLSWTVLDCVLPLKSFFFQRLQSGVGYAIDVPLIKYTSEGFVVHDNNEFFASQDKHLCTVKAPSDCKALTFTGCIPTFWFCDKS